MLRRLQRGLETLYRLGAAPDVRGFLLDEDARGELGATRRPREQLFVGGNADELDLGLFVDPAVVANLGRRDPRRRLDARNLEDLLLAVEGVSHFLCVIHCARSRRPVRALELELQAEVDKYVVCALLLEAQGAATERASGLGALLADGFRLADDLDHAERERYRFAVALSAAYVAALDRRFVRPRRIVAMLDELRRFYRLPFAAKRERIDALAA